MRTNSKLNILIVTPFALWMYIICISNIIMQELSGAPYVAGIITYVSAFIIFLCYYWLLLQNIRKMEDSAKYLKWTRFCRIVGIVAFIVAGCIVLLVQKEIGMKRQNTRRKCSHIRWKDVCLGLSIYKMNVMVNNKNLSKYGEYHGKRTNAY